MILAARIGALIACVLEAAVAAEQPDAIRLKMGKFRYSLKQDGRYITDMVIGIQRQGQDYSYQAESSGGDVSQRWESIAGRRFEPRSAALSFGPPSGRIPEFVLKYDRGRVAGTDFGARRKTGERRVDSAVPAGVVDQRIDWAAVMALDLRTAKTFDFSVYDPGTGVSRIHGRVAGEETVQVPAGRYDVFSLIYQIDKSGRTEHYRMLTTRSTPRVMVLEEMPNRLVSALTSITP